jgi:hypothetical protein
MKDAWRLARISPCPEFVANGAGKVQTISAPHSIRRTPVPRPCPDDGAPPGIRTRNARSLSPAPLPVGLGKHGIDGADGGIRTPNIRDLGPAPLPVGPRRLYQNGAPPGIRTRNSRSLSPAPLPVGLGKHGGGRGNRTLRSRFRDSALQAAPAPYRAIPPSSTLAIKDLFAAFQKFEKAKKIPSVKNPGFFPYRPRRFSFCRLRRSKKPPEPAGRRGFRSTLCAFSVRSTSTRLAPRREPANTDSRGLGVAAS